MKALRLAHTYPTLRSGLVPAIRKEARHPFAGGTFVVYADRTSHKMQPPGVIMEPRAAQMTGARILGAITIPPSSGVRKTRLSDIEGVPATPLDIKLIGNIRRLLDAGKVLPPIIVEVTEGGRVSLLDGNHRLLLARMQQAPSIQVKWIIR